MRICVIGAGAMGSALTGGIVAAGVSAAEDLTVADVSSALLESVSRRFGVKTTLDNAEAASGADVILLAVKPAVISVVLESLKRTLTQETLVISIAAGIKIASIEQAAGQGIPVIRAMPNTPCQVRAGAVAYSLGTGANSAHAELAERLFSAVGLAVEVPEGMLDAVTGLSGSGPAYIFMLIEALGDAGVAVGLPRDKAAVLAAQTVMGSAKMVLETGLHPAVLKDQVTSPGGTTIAGVSELERAGLRSAVFEAVKAATARSKELR